MTSVLGVENVNKREEGIWMAVCSLSSNHICALYIDKGRCLPIFHVPDIVECKTTDVEMWIVLPPVGWGNF